MFFEDIDLVHRNDEGLDMFDHSAFDLLGERFDVFTVVGQYVFDGNVTYTLECKCGDRHSRAPEDFYDVEAKDCGCGDVVFQPARPYHFGFPRTGRQRIMGILRGAIRRCHNPDSESYDNYGGRGISVCREWRDNPQSFYDWSMANGYEDDLTLDRRCNYSGYGPGNCRWVTMAVNLMNKRVHQDARGGLPA